LEDNDESYQEDQNYDYDQGYEESQMSFDNNPNTLASGGPGTIGESSQGNCYIVNTLRNYLGCIISYDKEHH
jgi:hypothetical protein